MKLFYIFLFTAIVYADYRQHIIKSLDKCNEDPSNCIELWCEILFNDAEFFKKSILTIDIGVKKFHFHQNGDNPSTVQLIESLKNIPGVMITQSNQNIGFSATFNFLMKSHPQTPYYFFAAPDVEYKPGYLQRFLNVFKREYNQKLGLVCNPIDWFTHIFITRTFIDTVGYMDENFFPAYVEDYDYGFRAENTDLKLYNLENDPGFIHHRAVNSKQSNPNGPYKKMLASSAHGHKYGQLKWGYTTGVPEKIYKCPFNDCSISYKDWVLDQNYIECIKSFKLDCKYNISLIRK